MAALVDENYVKTAFNIHKDVEDSRINPYLIVASRRLKKWVGDTNYADDDLKDVLKIAEATLVMHFMIRNLNTQIRSKGLVATESVEGNVTIRYLNPTETKQSEVGFLEQARELIDDLDIGSDIPPAPEVVLEDG